LVSYAESQRAINEQSGLQVEMLKNVSGIQATEPTSRTTIAPLSSGNFEPLEQGSPILKPYTVAGEKLMKGRAIKDTLMPDEQLLPGEFLTSESGKYQLIYQTDGNLVQYLVGVSYMGKPPAGWNSGTAGQQGHRVVMQKDGNLVIYGFYDVLWQSHTPNFWGSYLKVQDDGNIVIYGPVWDTMHGGNSVEWFCDLCRATQPK